VLLHNETHIILKLDFIKLFQLSYANFGYAILELEKLTLRLAS